MSHSIAKINIDNNGATDDPSWHLIDHIGNSDGNTLCTGTPIVDCDDVITKVVNKGGITCKSCLSIIKHYKSIKL